MEYARHEARMNAMPPGTSSDAKDRTSIRGHLQKLARRGDPTATRALEGPAFPEAVDYLWQWARSLHGRCGAGMGGLLPLSHTEIRAWRENMRVEVLPQEVDAIIAIDAVMRYPDESEVKDDG